MLCKLTHQQLQPIIVAGASIQLYFASTLYLNPFCYVVVLCAAVIGCPLQLWLRLPALWVLVNGLKQELSCFCSH
jgi:hypothetical protein